MRRRSFLGGLIGAAAMPALSGMPARSQGAPQRVLAAPASLRAKVRPGQPGWPNAVEWEQLKAVMGGRLVPAPLPFEPCRADASGAVCMQALARRSDARFLQSQPGGTQVSGWLDGWEANASVHAVAAGSVADVVAAVNFARERNLRLVVKGGGHSRSGQSSAPDSLMLWTRDLRSLQHHDAFVPQGGEGRDLPAQAVSVGAGARIEELRDFVTARHGRHLPCGGALVTVGGHVQAGGFGSFAKGFGLAAGNLLEAEIVTADGLVRVVNRHHEPDLFFAIGGGGAGFGVVTRLTLRTHPLPETCGFVSQTIRARGDSAFRRLLAAFLQFADENLVTPHWGEAVSVAPDNSLTIAMVFQGISEDEARAAWRPFWGWLYEHADLLEGPSAPRVRAMSGRDFWAMARLETRRDPPEGFWLADQPFEPGAYVNGCDSVWLPRRLIAPGRRDTFMETLFLASRQARVSLQFHKGLAGARDWVIEDARELAVHPVAVEAFALAVVADAQPGRLPRVAGHEPDREGGRLSAARMRSAMAALRRVTPEGGSHGPEADYFSAEWRVAHWGAHYFRLLEAKLRHDPGGLFFGHHAVGSEFWSEDGFTPVA